MWHLFEWTGRKKKIFFVVATSVVIVYSYFLLLQENWSTPHIVITQFIKSTDNKHYATTSNTRNGGDLNITVLPSNSANSIRKESGGTKSYVVNTSTCKIPDLNPWDDDILMLNKKCEHSDEVDPKCGDRPDRKWMYTQGSNLIVNYTAIKDAGYSVSSIRCCYYVIKRVEPTWETYDLNSDSVIEYSKKCRPIPLYDITNIEDEFIRVFCLSNSWPLLNDAVYREYFAFGQPKAHALKKISKWKSFTSNKLDLPPSIVMVGIDTNSRLNSHRTLPQTLKVFEEIGAVEFYGFTKVGENTFPNTLPLLCGISNSDIKSVCYKTDSEPLDNCPFIWKDFDKAGYLTLTAEDAPWAAIFNYLRAGFIKPPTDFYFRPFSVAWMTQKRFLPGELILNYMNDIIRRASQGAPVFFHSWLTTYGHHCINSVRFMDTTLAKFARSIDGQNAIFIFLSDHGDRFGPYRETTTGWYEDKLPSMWIHLPETVQKRFPNWKHNLQINSRRLTSHFDLYHTFVHVLNAYNTDSNFTVNTPAKKVGQSLLEPVAENRTCSSAGISTAYCACTEPKPIDINSKDETVQKTLADIANATISYLTKVLPKECASPEVKRLVSAKVMVSKGTLSIYILSLYTSPGDFLFEVTVQARKVDDNRNGSRPGRKIFFVESLNDILRMNKITRKVNCVTSPVIERYCYCL